MNTFHPQLRYQMLTIVLTIGVFGLWLFNFLPFGTRDSLITSDTGQFVVKEDGRLHFQNTDSGTDSDVFTVGNTSLSSVGTFDLAVSGSALPPALRYNGAEQVWQLSNDGIMFADILTGTDGSSLPLSGGSMTGAIVFDSHQDFTDMIRLGDDTKGEYVAKIQAGDGMKGSVFSQGAISTLAVDLLDTADGAGKTASYSGLQFSGDSSGELSLLQGCSNNQILKWNDSTHKWVCADDGGGAAAADILSVADGGTGVDGSTAPNGTLLIGNGSGYTLNTLTGSNGLSVANTSGSITLSLDVVTTGTTATTSSNSGLEITASGMRLLGGCSDDQVLSWSAGISAWICSNKSGGASDWTSTGSLTYLTSTTDDLALGGTTGTSSRFFFDVTTGNQIVFEGTGADDAFETTLVITNPTADRTITIPDASGTVALTADLHSAVTLSGENYLTLAGQVITANAVNLSGTHVTGTLAAARFGTLTGDVTTAGGSYATTIAADAVALTTDTTGNYVQSITNGSGIGGGNGGSEGAALTLALGALTADWNQTGAFNISLNNTSAGLKMLENGGTPTLFGIFDVADLSSTDKTYTFPDATITVNAAGDISGTTLASNVVVSSLTSVGTLGSLTVSGVIAANGGITFDNATDTLGAHTLSGTLDVNANILTNIGNSGTDFIASTGGLTLAGVLTANGGITVSGGQSLTAAALSYFDLGSITHNTTANQGLRLPNAASATPSNPISGEGYLAWDSAGNQLIAYNGSSWAPVSAGLTAWDAIVDPTGNGSIAMGETVQTLDWNTAGTAAGFDGLSITLTNDAATDANTQRALVVANQDDSASTGTTEAIMQLVNRDSNETVGSGLVIENTGAGTMTNALQILETAGTLTTAITIGNNITTGISIGTGVTTGISVGSGGIVATGEIVFTNTGGTASLTVNDEASDATPFVVDTAGNVGIGTASPNRVLDIVQAASAPQLRLSKDLTNYSEFTVDSVGDLQLAATGSDIRALSENLWVCDNDACPALTLTGDGNIFVENLLKFGNGVYIKNDSATELGVYDNDANAMLIFDEQ